MKVLYVIDSLHGGGSETSTVELLPALRARGVETSIVTLLPDDGSLSDRLAELNVDVHRLSDHSWQHRLSALRDLIRAVRPDVVHTSLTWSDLLGRISSFGADVPVVTSLVNSSYGPEHRKRAQYGSLSVRIWQGVDVVASRRTSLFHAVSEEVRRLMARRLLVSPDRIRVVYRGRDEQRLGRRDEERRRRVRKELEVPLDAPLVLVVGRLAEQKAPEVSIKAFGLVQRRYREAQLLIAGREGDASEKARATAADIDNVRFLGHRQDIADLMAAADCLSFPSRWEGLPGTVIEALALELPVVATRIPTTAEALGDVGWPVVDIDHPQTLAQGIQFVLDGGEHIERARAAGRARFEDTFTVNRAADGMLDLYSEALERRDMRRFGTAGNWWQRRLVRNDFV